MLHIRISNDRQKKDIDHPAGPLEFGRAPGEGCERFIIEDRYVSRTQMRIEEHSPRQVKIINLGAPITFPDQSTLDKKADKVFDLPVRMMVGYTTVEISPGLSLPADDSLQTIARPFQVKRQPDESSLASLGESPSPAKLTQWFETLLSVQRAAAGSNEFYQQTAQAVVKLVGLDRGMVLLRRGEQWETVGSHSRALNQEAHFSYSVIARVMRDQRTFFQSPGETETAASLMALEAVVASPIFDTNEQIVGVVYGSRDIRADIGRRGVTPLEAQVTQLLAGAATVGLARVAKEAEAARVRHQFEQFVPVQVARELERNPDLLAGQDRTITVMFTDLRGFSRFSEQLGPRETYQLMGDVMDLMTAEVLDHSGIIVDYYGDGMEALWNAPTDQEDHAELACRTALAIQRAMPKLNKEWSSRLDAPLRVGVGVNTGPALVGNAGSNRRLKYGPRGHTVNLASRVEGATKQFGLPVLITGSVARLLSDKEFATRRLCRVRAVGMSGAVELYELAEADTVDQVWQSRKKSYEEALELFEKGQWSESLEPSTRLLESPMGNSDKACELLCGFIKRAIERNDKNAESIFELTSK